MKLQPINEVHKSRGSAMILVVVVTVLLSIVGVMFLMISRVGEMETAAVADNRDLDAAVDTVVNRIHDVLIEDLFGKTRANINSPYVYEDAIVDSDPATVDFDLLNIYSDEPYDYPVHNNVGPDGIYGTADDIFIDSGFNGTLNESANNDDVWLPGQMDDFWLASLEPVLWSNNGTPANPVDDIYVWSHITDLWGTIQGTDDSLFYQRYSSTQHNKFFQTNGIAKRWIDPDYTNNATENVIGNGWHTSALWDKWQVSAYNVRAKVIGPKDRMQVVAAGFLGADKDGGNYPNPWEDAVYVSLFGARADADGDGVADSRWVQVPNLTTNRGKPVFAAVRIIDNCAMLNLNAAHCFYQEPYNPTNPLFDEGTGDPILPFNKPWFLNENDYDDFVLDAANLDTARNHLYHKNHNSGSGRFLTEINYLPFLRGYDLNGDFFGTDNGDDWYDLMISRKMYDTVNDEPLTPYVCDWIFKQIGSAGTNLRFFDISNELELRNRYLLTGPTESKIEQKDVWNFTLDAGGGVYSALEIPREDKLDSDGLPNFFKWKFRVDPANFDTWDSAGNMRTVSDPLYPYRYRYDRRHVCTVYSYDRNYEQMRAQDTYYHATYYDVMEANLMGMGLAPAQAELARRVFYPKYGPATTDLSVPGQAAPLNNILTRQRILHLLIALREYYLPDDFLTSPNPAEFREAALKAAQIISNIIDYSDDDAIHPTTADRQGPFYNAAYGSQANADCTFITKDIIDDLIAEVSAAVGITLPAYDFGLNATDIVFGYEKQPYFSEVVAQWNGTLGQNNALTAIALEVVNPYPDTQDMENWAIKIGKSTIIPFNNNPLWDIPEISSGRAVYHGSLSGVLSVPGGVLLTPDITELNTLDTLYYTPTNTVEIQLLRPAPAWCVGNSNPAFDIDYIVVDRIAKDDVRKVLGADGIFSLKRDDNDWKFIYAEYAPVESITTTPYVMGTDNTATVSVPESFQLGVSDEGFPLSRRHELEVLSLYGNGPEDDPNSAVTAQLADLTGTAEFHFDLVNDPDILDYVCTISRPDVGSLPGRININTAPAHVIAAAIPPTLADPNAADPSEPVTFSALDLAKAIVANRPYESLSDLLNIPQFRQYETDTDVSYNAGMQSIDGDIEERDWVLSNLANKLTVRSDVFTAYILVRLGEDGPQRRMIGIFDRSHVWDKNDRPKLVALHPVPDPR